MSDLTVTSAASSMLVFPTSPISGGGASFRLARRPDGVQVVVAFTTVERLGEVMGPRQGWTRCCAGAAHAMLEPLGITQICVDPELVVVPLSAARASA